MNTVSSQIIVDGNIQVPIPGKFFQIGFILWFVCEEPKLICLIPCFNKTKHVKLNQ